MNYSFRSSINYPYLYGNEWRVGVYTTVLIYLSVQNNVWAILKSPLSGFEFKNAQENYIGQIVLTQNPIDLSENEVEILIFLKPKQFCEWWFANAICT